MKKLLFIIEHLNAGGAERSLADILTYLDYTKYRVDLLLVQDKGDYEAEIPSQVNIILRSLNSAFGSMKNTLFNAVKNRDWFSFWFRLIYFFSSHTNWSNLRYTRRLFKDIDNDYDCVIACRQSFICNELASYVFRGKKKISWWHHGSLGMTEAKIKRLKQTYSAMTAIVAVSKSSAQIVKDGFDINKNRIRMIPNMICIDRIKSHSIAFAPEKDNNLVIVSVGRFSPEKNVQLCVKIGKEVKEQEIDFKWYIVGDGEDRESIEKEVTDNNLKDNFIFTGRVNNPYPFIAVADVFVHPSLVESQGIAVLESMVLKTPVVVMKSQGPKEYIADGINGYLVDNSPKQFAERIIKLYRNSSISKQIADNAYKTALLYSPEKVIRLVDNLFNEED